MAKKVARTGTRGSRSRRKELAASATQSIRRLVHHAWTPGERNALLLSRAAVGFVAADALEALCALSGQNGVSQFQVSKAEQVISTALRMLIEPEPRKAHQLARSVEAMYGALTEHDPEKGTFVALHALAIVELAVEGRRRMLGRGEDEELELRHPRPKPPEGIKEVRRALETERE